MKIRILVSFFILSSFQFLSCKKFLEEKSKSDVIPSTAQALNEFLLGEGYQIVGINKAVFHFSDDVECFKFGTGNIDDFRETYTWQPARLSNYPAGYDSDPWGTYYRFIQICNVVIDYSAKVTGTVTEKDHVKGQAYVLRAFYYFNLINYYAKPFTDRFSNPSKDLGVPLILTSGVSLKGKPRNTVEEVYEQIISDFETGIQMLNSSNKKSSVYRINAIGGQLLLSRVYLHLGKWDKAIEAATLVLTNKSDLMELRDWGTPNQDTRPVISASNEETIWAFGSPNENILVGDGTGHYGVSNSLKDLFEDGDLRNGIYFQGNFSIKRKKMSFNQNIANTLRVSEALLNRAEAYAHLNKQGQTANAQLALKDLNRLRSHRFLPGKYQDLISNSADDLLQKCYDEKRREFFDEENHRWFDLRRTGMPSLVHSYFHSPTEVLRYKLEDHDPAYVLSIPMSATERNPLLIQNPEAPERIGY